MQTIGVSESDPAVSESSFSVGCVLLFWITSEVSAIRNCYNEDREPSIVTIMLNKCLDRIKLLLNSTAFDSQNTKICNNEREILQWHPLTSDWFTTLPLRLLGGVPTISDRFWSSSSFGWIWLSLPSTPPWGLFSGTSSIAFVCNMSCRICSHQEGTPWHFSWSTLQFQVKKIETKVTIK